MREPKSSTTPSARVTTKLLAGANVVVTRPVATAASLKRRVRMLGGTAIGLPGIALKVTDAGPETKAKLSIARQSDIVIFVSPAAASFTFALQPGLHFARHCAILAVGSGTARALERRGVSNVHRPTSARTAKACLHCRSWCTYAASVFRLSGQPGGRGLL